jgi:SAM-dependent methyltransferase
MRGMLEAALANPWDTLRTVLDGPLHPGGREATEALLDRAGVTAETRLVDVGCGAGQSVAMARDRGVEAIGLDRDPGANGTVRGDITRLPFHEGSVDVVLAECVMCLAANRDRALAEAYRVLEPGGTLAVSDVVVEDSLPDLPEPMIRALCLQNSRSRTETVSGIEDVGFVVEGIRDHREELLEMRDQVASTVNYEGLLSLMGDRGTRVLDGIHDVEQAVDDGRIDYISVVARRSMDV